MKKIEIDFCSKRFNSLLLALSACPDLDFRLYVCSDCGRIKLVILDSKKR